MSLPFYETLAKLSQNMTGGNFGLWYNKFIPITNFDKCKPCDDQGNDTNVVPYYEKQFSSFKKEEIKKLLEKKHIDQVNFCQSFSEQYEIITVTAKLKAPLITGIGESHPHEVSMLFEHNLGIPYIPASGIKGIVRLAHTLTLIANISDIQLQSDRNGELYFDDEHDATIVNLFGSQVKRGGVIFLDAYPESVPALHVDIMNPHYGDYYSDDSHTNPPADNQNPTPIKFLTVAQGTVFVFRALVDKQQGELIDNVKESFKKVLSEEGVGAKTAIGHGVFDILSWDEPDSVKKIFELEQRVSVAQERIRQEEKRKILLEQMTPEDRIVYELENSSPEDTRINEILSGLDQMVADAQRQVAVSLKVYWQKEKKWEKKDCSKKQIVKVDKVKSVLGEK